MRIDKYLTECGFGTRSEVKKKISKKEISINGKKVNSSSIKVDIDNDIVEYDGEKIVYKKYRYYMMNKKAGYITAIRDKYDKTVMDLLPEYVVKKDLFPVGRLDKDTEGLLLFTNNGDLAHKMTSPKQHVDKKYYVNLEKEISESDIRELEQGVIIEVRNEDYCTKKAVVEKISEKEINLTISEGKFHQVKKMLEAVGNEVVYLKRVSFSKLELGELELGKTVEIDGNDLL